MSETIEGEATEVAAEEEEAALAKAAEYAHLPAAGPPAVRERSPLATADVLTVEEMISQRRLVLDVMQQVMKQDVHFGKIPGVDKPTLLKPGAEVLAVTFRLDAEPEVEQVRSPDGHLDVTCRTTMWHIPTGSRVGSGVGSATTRESKYAYRQEVRVCPVCEQSTVFKSKPGTRNAGGYYCWAKRGGCGAEWSPGTEQAAAFDDFKPGRTMRPPDELPDFYNTVLKMAAKRSLVAAILNCTAASESFTQDVEDTAPETHVDLRTDQTTQAPRAPKTWGEVVAAFDMFPDCGWQAWLRQLIEAVVPGFTVPEGKNSVTAQTAEQRKLTCQKAASAYLKLRELHDPNEFPPPDRRTIQEAFAFALDGAVLPGPEMALSPDEDEGGQPRAAGGQPADGGDAPEVPSEAAFNAVTATQDAIDTQRTESEFDQVSFD